MILGVLQKTVFYYANPGPIEKRVANSDSSENFGLGGITPEFFYRYCIACKIESSNSKKIMIFKFLEISCIQKIAILQAIQ